MPVITLPDGSQRSFDCPVSVFDVASGIGAGLAKAALAGIVNGKEVDVTHIIEANAKLEIITEKSCEGLQVIRHSAAHLLAQTVKSLFPDAQVTIGPVIDNGFYYDFSYKRPFTNEDLAVIENKMAEFAQADFIISRRELSREDAVTHFNAIEEYYKVDIIKSLPANEILSLYKQGDFEDLCRGPHVPSTGKIKHFKLMKVAGAYWRGDSDNEMLQRIYGIAFGSKKELKAYLDRLQEAEKRDHRKLAKKLDLFHLQEESPGMVFWHPKGWSIYTLIEDYMRRVQRENGYQEIKTPQIVDSSLWKKSGHWDKFRDDMFTIESESRDYAIKPMNCPCHVQVFKQGLKSYRDLPLRLSEFGSCHRNEASGTLQGLMRVRGFVQDDGHIFCTEAMIQSEVSDFVDLLRKVYQDFGFNEIIVRLSTRPEQRVGSDDEWNKSEKALSSALDTKEIPWELLPGEGAFYGPKVEFALKDCLERIWQCGTIQVDFSMPSRLGAYYVAEDGSRHSPVMLHRAILGSFERFIGILIEHYDGAFPCWLAPQQVVIMNITGKQADYASKLQIYLQDKEFRSILDLRNEKIGFKIREHTLQRVPYLVVVGDQEVESRTIAVRTRRGKDLGVMSIDDFVARLSADIMQKGAIGV